MRPAPAVEFGHHQQEHQQGYMQLQHHTQPQQQQQQQQQQQPRRDGDYKTIIMQYVDGTHISGEMDLEDQMIYIKELIAAVKDEQAHWDTAGVDWDAECIFSVRIAVHVVTAIIVEFHSERMGCEVFKRLIHTGYIYEGKPMSVMLGRDFFIEGNTEFICEEDERKAILYLRHVPCKSDIPVYTKEISEHYRISEDNIKVDLLSTEIMGAQTHNFDGTVREGGLKGTFYEGMPDCMKPKVKTKRPLDNITFGKNMRSKGECHRSQCEMGCNCGD